MIYLDRPVIVEGKYDKIKLSAVVGSPIITTGGFSLFKDREKTALIRKLAQKGGVIVLTDSDGAGRVIRGRIKSVCGECPVVNLYIPQIKGVEKRKSAPSKEGWLGVEGMEVETLEKLFEKYAASPEKSASRRVSRLDLYEAGLSGGKNSAILRRGLCRELGLPEEMSSGAMLEAVNILYTYEEFADAVGKLERRQEK